MFYAEYNLRLMVYLLLARYDIACACDLDTALPVRWISACRRKITVYDAHEFFTESPELNGRPWVKGIWEWIGKVTIPGFHLRYTVGEQLANLMSAKYGVSFQVIRNISPQIKNEWKVTAIHERQKILLYQGALNIGRGLDTMIRAMLQLPDWEFWLAGDGDITNTLKGLVRSLGLESRVKFLGWVSPADLPGLMHQARLGINLRDAASLNDYYSLPNKFFDAIHTGLPSINMDFPEYRAVCEKYPCAILISELSEKAILEAITAMERNPQQLIQMASACSKAAQELNWQVESKKLTDMYRALTEPKN
jgi:glycosyltransferase involved in cell wall biosynthesis